jgi:hypothetical protein
MADAVRSESEGPIIGEGATVEDIAEAPKLTPQAIYCRFRNERMNHQTTPGRPNVPEPVLGQEATLAPSDRSTPVDDSVLGPEQQLPG